MAFNSTINTGTSPNDGQGDGLRTNMRKLIENDNFLKHEHENLQDEFDNVFKDNLIYDIAGTGENYFKAIKLDNSSNPYRDRVILLIPLVSTNVTKNNLIFGKLISRKNGSNMWDTFDVSAQSVWSNTTASFFSSGQKTLHKLVTCTYNGIDWLAIKIHYEANTYTSYFFEGFHNVELSIDPNSDSLNIIEYYERINGSNPASVVNNEINNSIQDYSSPSTFVFFFSSYSKWRFNLYNTYSNIR